MTAVTIVDCKVVEVRPEDVLLDQLRESIALTEKDPRWLSVTDRTPVLWEDVMTTWGSLAGNERSMCDFNEDGVLEGSFPF
jgi:hypothetical protein